VNDIAEKMIQNRIQMEFPHYNRNYVVERQTMYISRGMYRQIPRTMSEMTRRPPQITPVQERIQFHIQRPQSISESMFQKMESHERLIVELVRRIF